MDINIEWFNYKLKNCREESSGYKRMRKLLRM